jgi:hypothetical protein
MGGALIPVLLGRLIRNRGGVGVIAAAAFASNFSFFLITNFMVWATDRLYPLTIGGLSECYLAGIPFYRNQVLGDAVTPLQSSAVTPSSSACASRHDRLYNVRIVSLLASATEIVCVLGAGEMLVWRSHECDNPEWVRRLPVCSAPTFDVSVSSCEIDAEVRRRLRSGEPLYHIHGELIHELRADLLISQSHCEVCAVTPADLERSGACASPARQVALSASSLEQIFQGVQRIARELGLEERGEAVIGRERERLDTVRERAARLRRPSVVMVGWTDPLFAMGKWGPELEVSHYFGNETDGTPIIYSYGSHFPITAQVIAQDWKSPSFVRWSKASRRQVICIERGAMPG